MIPDPSADSVPSPAPRAELDFNLPFESFPAGDQARAIAAAADQLETRGITSHFPVAPGSTPQFSPAPATPRAKRAKQLELVKPALLHKDTIVRKLRDVGAFDLAEPLDRCHTEESVAVCTGCQAPRFFWNRCDHLECPVCQPRLARERSQAVEWWLEMLKRPLHVVLTIRNSATITFAGVKAFKAAISKLRRSKLAESWRGGTWAIEVTNEGRGWHLHAHLAVDADYIDPRQLSAKWAKLVGQDFAIVRVKPIHSPEYAKELAKYAVKGSMLAGWSGTDIASFIHAFSGQRTFGVFGNLYGKRREWSEFIASVKEKAAACECGCNSYKVLSLVDWETSPSAQVEHVAASRPPPPDLPWSQSNFAGRNDAVLAGH